MPTRPRQMKLGAFLMETGHHVAAWRHPDGVPDGGLNLPLYVQLARAAEAAHFDAIFVADSVAANVGHASHRVARSDRFEPITLLSALSAVTRHLGLIATVTTSYNEPYHIARKFASLDHLSGGRAGWNMVTSDNPAEAGNFGRETHFSHAERYERAREFHHVVTGLWDSWDDDAFVRDQERGIYYEPDKVRVLGHRGKHFSVAGPLNTARPPQGWPVVVQAGASPAGRELAAQTADVVFTAHPTLQSAQSFYADIKDRLPQYGRGADDLKIMPGLSVIVGRTQEEADERHAQLQALIHPEAGLSLLARMIGNFDLSAYPLDGPLPELPLTDSGQQSRQKLLSSLANTEHLTIRQLYLRIATGRGHFTVTGTARTVADAMQEWFERDAADGFNVMPADLPNGLLDFCSLVVPELQRRGLFRTAYEGHTLRENLGLKRPAVRAGIHHTSEV
jgi:FMN-dependent oxidoreductase (nitrilotriacetate monooxygenase family)